MSAHLPSVRQRLLNRFLILVLTASTALLPGSCSVFNETVLEESLGRPVDLIDYAYDIADDLIVQAFPPLLPRNPELPILTTTFVDNNHLEKASQFGRLLQEHIGARLVQHGYAVKETRLRKELEIEPKSGELFLSRRLSLINDIQPAQAVLVGTVSMAERILYISVRLVKPDDATVIAARNYRLYMDKHVLAMFDLQPAGTNDMIQEPSEPLVNRLFY